jgi:hypothetical protein
MGGIGFLIEEDDDGAYIPIVDCLGNRDAGGGAILGANAT